MNSNHTVLDLFKTVVVSQDQKVKNYNFDLISRGIVLDFNPTILQKEGLKSYFQPLNVKTLFSVDEAENASPEELITKQFLHYIEVYGLNAPGLLNLEVSEGRKVSITFVSGIVQEELSEKVWSLVYSNAPIKNVPALKNVVDEYKIDVDVNKIRNNEFRCMMFDENKHVFASGDDAVRYLVYKATGSTLLIKDRKTVDAMSHLKNRSFLPSFLENHALQLSRVFNRHKRLLIPLKNTTTRTVINKITRLSKQNHVPIHEALNKTFLNRALSKGVTEQEILGMLNSGSITLRDKFKYLNLLEWKSHRLSIDSFVIRSGKIHNESGRKVHEISDLARVMRCVIASLKEDFAHLHDKVIVLDENVDYGLPISRKQTVGNLPFGTRIAASNFGSSLSYGVHWRNDWGACDLDLSMVDMKGQRTGWGAYCTYAEGRSDVVFSGDVTFAPDGAMEFFDVKKGANFGLFINIFSGEVGAECELVIGTKSKKQWIEDVVIREKTKLESRGSILGFIQGKDFIVYQGRLNDKVANFGEKNPLIEKSAMNQWTVKRLFETIGVNYLVDTIEDMDYNLSYNSFTYDKLEELLLAE